MVNLTYLEADYRICTDEKFSFDNLKLNFIPRHDYIIKRYTDHWKMTLDQMKEAIDTEKERRLNLCASFELEADNSILHHAKMVAKYMDYKDSFHVELDNPLELKWDKKQNKHLATDNFSEKFKKRFGENWSYSYFDTKVVLHELMAYVTYYLESDYSIGPSHYVCAVAEYPVTPKLIRIINRQLTSSSRLKAANEYTVLEKAERNRKIEAFRLKQIYGD